MIQCKVYLWVCRDYCIGSYSNADAIAKYSVFNGCMNCSFIFHVHLSNRKFRTDHSVVSFFNCMTIVSLCVPSVGKSVLFIWGLALKHSMIRQVSTILVTFTLHASCTAGYIDDFREHDVVAHIITQDAVEYSLVTFHQHDSLCNCRSSRM